MQVKANLKEAAKKLGAVFGITGKPKDYLPKLAVGAALDLTGTKEALEGKLKEAAFEAIDSAVKEFYDTIDAFETRSMPAMRLKAKTAGKLLAEKARSAVAKAQL